MLLCRIREFLFLISYFEKIKTLSAGAKLTLLETLFSTGLRHSTYEEIAVVGTVWAFVWEFCITVEFEF